MTRQELIDIIERIFSHDAEQRAHIDDAYWKYMDLINQVGKTFPNETRHETAKRYLIQAEQQSIRQPQQNKPYDHEWSSK